jgi:hypothetical protein
MPEIRTRLTLDDCPSANYGFMVAAHRPDPGRLFNAVDLDCPACTALAGDRCGERLCADRLQLCVTLMRAGELEAKPIPARPLRCPDCQRRRNQSGTKFLACSDEHRCVAQDRAKRCAAPKEPGRDRCIRHLAMR